jgi:NAD(P)-dependent dehydrogenase (short-subunit alcohol dehydrogenase family)
MTVTYNFTGEVAYVTGAAGQLGIQISNELMLAGAKVIMVDRCKGSLERAVAKLELSSADYLLVEADISEKDEVRRSIDVGVEKFGKITMQVNNAGHSVFTPWFERTPDEIASTLDTNIKGTITCIIEFLKVAKKAKVKTSIVNVGSHYGQIAPDPRIYIDLDRRNSEIYGASKAGVCQLTKYFATNAIHDGYETRVNAVAPGGIFNPDDPQGGQFLKEYSARVPLGRMANTEEIVRPILFLLSSDASYINGTSVVIDGGMSCW